MRHIIVDASIAQKWFDENEVNHKLAQKILQEYLEGKSKISAPYLLLYELTNIWACKQSLPQEIVSLNFVKLSDLQIKIVQQKLSDFKRTALLAKKYKISAYDASYIVLAKKMKCNFITADQKLVSRVNLPFVKML